MSAPEAPKAPIPKTVVYVCSVCGNEIRVDLLNGQLPASMRCEKCGTVFPFESQTRPQPGENQWTPEAVENLIKLIDTLAKEYLQFRREDSQAKQERLAAVTGHNRRLVYSMIVFLAAIIGLMSLLTGLGKVSGDALLFLAGTITGYILIMVQNFVESPVEETEPVPSS